MGLEMKYFVLKPNSNKKNDAYAHASRMAMITYAAQISGINSAFADELIRWVDKEINNSAKFIDGKLQPAVAAERKSMPAELNRYMMMLFSV